MKITLTKKVTFPDGNKKPKGLSLEVTNDYGLELIKAGKAVEFGVEAPKEEEQLNLD